MSAVIGSSIVLFIPIILIMVKAIYLSLQIHCHDSDMYNYRNYNYIFIISRYSSVCSSAFICWTLQKTFCAMVHICIKCINAFVSSILNYYYGIMDTNLLIAGTHQRKWYLDLIANGGSFTYNAHPVFIILIFACIPRSMILLVFTFMIQYIVTASLHDAARIAQLTYLKETDSLTRLFNKNKYNEMVSMYYPNVDNITVIFWDLNNLKIINDTYGHEYGDKALSALASVLYAHSDEQCRRVYRFGGDEFVMIIDNPHDGEADRIISAVKDELMKCSYDISIEISSAVGIASGNGSDIIEIVKMLTQQCTLTNSSTTISDCEILYMR